MLRVSIKFRRLRDRLMRCNALTLCIVLAAIVTVTVVIRGLANGDEDDWFKFSNEDISAPSDSVFFEGCIDTYEYLRDDQYQKMNASFVMLTRNEELYDVIKSVRSIEEHFNQWFQYPYVFLNDVPFSEEFQTRLRSESRASMEFGTLDKLDWEFPEKIRESFAFQHALNDQGDRGIMYGSEESYHKMCRFYSGLFYKHPLVQKFEWYWRLEPDVEFFCDITYDPFLEMARNDKKYGFTVILPELYWTVANLFRYTRSFIRQTELQVGSLWNLFTENYQILETEDSLLASRVNYDGDVDPRLSEKVAIDHMLDTGNSEDEMGLRYLIGRSRSKAPILQDKFDDQEYNLCHFWSNFEIARVDVFNNELYNSYFQYLEEQGGFWRERWGDAPVHSLGLGMLLDIEDVHYFRDIGYRHSTIQHCPKNKLHGQLPYTPAEKRFSRHSWKTSTEGFETGTGCRCRCDRRKSDIEDTAFHCMDRWTELLLTDREPPINALEVEQSIKFDYLHSN